VPEKARIEWVKRKENGFGRWQSLFFFIQG